jgi:hypothetical protein
LDQKNRQLLGGGCYQGCHVKKGKIWPYALKKAKSLKIKKKPNIYIFYLKNNNFQGS